MGLTAIIPKCARGCFSYGDSVANLILGPLVSRGCLYPVADGCLPAKYHSDFSVHHHRNFWNWNFANLFHFKMAFVTVDLPNYPRQSLHFKFSLIIYITPCCHRQMTYSQLQNQDVETFRGTMAHINLAVRFAHLFPVASHFIPYQCRIVTNLHTPSA